MLLCFVESYFDFIDNGYLFTENVVLCPADCNILILYSDAILACYF